MWLGVYLLKVVFQQMCRDSSDAGSTVEDIPLAEMLFP
jgi:hypothetical protein